MKSINIDVRGQTGGRHLRLIADAVPCAAALLVAVGCTGRIGNLGGADGNQAGTQPGEMGGTPVTPAGAPCVPAASFAPARFSLISDDQYRNVVRDAFGVTLHASLTITTTPSISGAYSYNENAQVEMTT